MTTLTELKATQPHAAQVLAQAVTQSRRHHAYLLIGGQAGDAERLAKVTARSLVCTARPPASPDACGQCAACRKLDGGNHPDVLEITPGDKPTIAIEKVREVISRLSLRALEAPQKLVLIFGADLMTPQAQNAVLKTLEEPPGPTCFFLTALRARALLPTIRSRTQALRLAPRDRLLAWQSLAAGGLGLEVARLLGALLGDDLERAQAVSETAGEVRAALQSALTGGSTLSDALRVAADLGGDKERADLATACLEVWIRDAQARRRGAGPSQLYDPEGPSLERAALDLAAGRLQDLRRLAIYNPNRTLGLESLLLALRGEAAG